MAYSFISNPIQKMTAAGEVPNTTGSPVAATTDGGLAVNTVDQKLFMRAGSTIVPLSTYDTTGVSGITTPPKINNRDHRWSVLNFADGGASPADYRDTFEAALRSGEKLWVPPGEYVINSLNTETLDENGDPYFYCGVVVEQSGLPIDIEFHKNARVKAGDIFNTNNSRYLFRLKSIAPGATFENVFPTEPFRRSGGSLVFSHATGFTVDSTSHTCVLMDVQGFLKPEITGVYFNGGPRSPGSTGYAGYVGAGRLDTCLSFSSSIDPVVTHNVFRGAYDLAIYENGRTKLRGIVANGAVAANGSDLVTFTFGSAHGMTPGDRLFPVLSATLAGINMNQEFVVDSITSTTVLKGKAKQTATSTATYAPSFSVTDMNYARLGADLSGDGSLYAFNYFSNCNGAISMKRCKKGTRVIGNQFRDCGAGIKMSDTQGRHDYGAHLLVMGNTFNRIVGRSVAGYGSPGIRVIGNEIYDFGKVVTDTTGTLDDYGTETLAAVDLVSCPGAIVQGNSIRLSNRYSFVKPGGQNTIAFRLQGGEGFIDASNDCDITGNVVVGVPQAVLESSACSNNTFNNTVKDPFVSSVINGENPNLTVRGTKAFEPELVFTGGGSAIYASRGGSYTIVNSVVELEAYLDVSGYSTSPAPSGTLKIVMPFTNTTGRPIHTSSCVGQFCTIGAGAQLIGRMPIGSNELLLYKLNNGALTLITPAEYTSNGNLQVDIRIPLPDPGTINI